MKNKNIGRLKMLVFHKLSHLGAEYAGTFL